MKLSTPLLPKGAISEVFGASSCGKTALMHAFLAEAAGGLDGAPESGECCAVIDVLNAFDPYTAAQAGVNLRRLLWVRGAGGRNSVPVLVEHAFKAVDLLLHSGGFGLVVLDLSEVQPRDLNRIPLSYWYRFRLTVQNTPTRFIVAADVPVVKSCARLQLEAKREQALWNGPVFDGLECRMEPRKMRNIPVVMNGVMNPPNHLRSLPLAG